MSVKVFWQTFLTSLAAWMIVCMSSRLLLQSWAWEETRPGNVLQFWVLLMCCVVCASDSHLIPVHSFDRSRNVKIQRWSEWDVCFMLKNKIQLEQKRLMQVQCFLALVQLKGKSHANYSFFLPSSLIYHLSYILSNIDRRQPNAKVIQKLILF